MLVNVHEAKTRLSLLLKKAENGEDIVIARNGHPIARLVAYKPDAASPRRPGGWEGRVRMTADFDALPHEIADAFAGRLP